MGRNVEVGYYDSLLGQPSATHRWPCPLRTPEDQMKLPDWNAAEWVLVLTLAELGCVLASLLAGWLGLRCLSCPSPLLITED